MSGPSCGRSKGSQVVVASLGLSTLGCCPGAHDAGFINFWLIDGGSCHHFGRDPDHTLGKDPIRLGECYSYRARMLK